MAAHAATEEDVLGLARQDTQAAVQLFAVRGGKMVGRDVYLLDAPRETDDATVLAGFVQQYYERATCIPPTVLVPVPPGRRRRARGVPGRPARDGRPAPRPAARRQARAARAGHAQRHRDAGPRARALARGPGQDALALWRSWPRRLVWPGRPRRIECYDISNLQGAQSVGSMVVFEDGRPRTGEYRRFRIKDVKGANDYASHQEVLRRRFQAREVGRGGERGGAALAPAGPRRDRRRQGPALGGEGRAGRARLRGPGRRGSGQGARGDLPAPTATSRCCSRPRPRRCT